ncbi:13375_t:CDS:10 [Entrophospora sp. SA101]|nr:15291_t:CDS:10 [Entrophospora sp. SA101]CAJ0763040.1 13375_t:CDS:10 [Entrophospora sp. SA101]CAJ0877287.1 9739_t:CDS:10 [Entrophospora sp. SA101]CAJ0902797.1 13675_t:CDS:10 [Entrophospora sp. SA101]
MQMDYEILEKNEEYEDDSCIKVSSHFEQADEFFSNLSILLKATAKDENSDQDDVEQERILRKLIGLEQPYLLDPHLEKMVKPIIELLRSYIKSAIAQSMIVIKFGTTDNPDYVQVPKILKRLFKLLYYTMKIRGYKTIVSDLEPTFYFMLLQDPKDYSGWETRYVLLIWLSLISMIPFDLKTVDSRTSTGSDKIPLVENMIGLSKFYLKATGKERDGAAILLSRLLTRRDMAEKYLNNYVQWARDEARNNKDVFTITGILTSLCATYKLGQRQSLLPTLETAWPCLFILEENQIFANNALVRKMLVKLAQRFGLCYLKPKIASWRYQRGSRSLKDNLQTTSKPNIDPSNIQKSLKEEGEEDEEIPDQIEEIIEILLNGLKHKDTVVRWSAAKGLGRLSQRLPQELADDVIGSLFELFSENTYKRNNLLELSAVSDYTWHGTCLAVAELARRGLLLPERLKEVIPWAIKALTFDLKRGSHSIGAHVRDAACYVCWSFARAYAPEVLAPHVPELANSLVVASVFDREVNVRRASSAAFQENVGRLGIFPHGIEIITTADYFTVGNRVNAFLEISVKIAKFSEYRYHLIDHLSKVTISNWDKTMRALCSKALYNLAFLDINYMVNSVLHLLIPQALSHDMHTRHGGLLAAGEICLAWSEINGNDRSWVEIHKKLIEEISYIIINLPKNLFTDFGSEITCQAASHYISCLSKANWPITNDIMVVWKEVVYDLLSRKDEYGQDVAVKAVKEIVNTYGIQKEEILSYPFIRGFSLALGVVNYNRISPLLLESVIDALVISASIQKTKILNDPETRRNSIISLTKISTTLGESFKTVASEHIFHKIVDTYFMGLEDYSADSRGDIGSWIREACMNGFMEFCPLIQKLDFKGMNCKPWWTNDLSKNVFSSLLKQSVERIDKIRSCAGKVLLNLLYKKIVIDGEEKFLFDVPGREILQKILPRDKEIHWIKPSELYPRLIKLLILPEYRFDLLTGLVIAAGGLTESLQDRIVIPLLEVIDLLFEAGILQKIDQNNFRFCGMTTLSGSVKNRALFQLLSLLIHPFPKIRRSTADQLYLTITSAAENEESEQMLQIEDILTNTDWYFMI